ncbi:tetratricopeptide repeat protein [Litoribacillus peritrichatus]|uniref:Tetratricopeptide repeat protein n=1 Tax=Litoribacillus peritrichatus TaxID=718191 RepID=A0ABP7NG20_9GAMM
MNRILFLAISALYLAGCTTTHKAPVVGGGQQEPVYQPQLDDKFEQANDTTKGVTIKPQKERGEIAGNSNRNKRHDTRIGVVGLLASAETYGIKKQWAKAQRTLERAQRIDPKEPKIYYELAITHLNQNQPRQAEQLCRKGLSLAHGNASLQKQLWTAMAKALEAQGKTQKAQKALRRAHKIQA